MASDDEHDAIFENRYRQEDPEMEGPPSDEEAELAAYLAAKAEVAPDQAAYKNDEEQLKQKLADVQADPKAGFVKLRSLQVPFSRPSDYFAEMVKSDAHMEKVRQSLLSEKKRIEDAEERKKQRELKKFGKKVQTAKLLERAKEKKTHMDALKKWRKDHPQGANDDDFPIELGGAAPQPARGGASAKGKPNVNNKKKPGDKHVSSKRKYKDERYGFGGGKRHLKDNTADSTNDFKFDKTKNKELPQALKKKFGVKGSGPAKKIAKGPRSGGKGGKGGKQNRPGKRARTNKKR